MTTSRVLILGSSGFVGSHLAEVLKQGGSEVLGLSSKQLNLIPSESVSQLKETIRPEDTLVLISALTPDRGRDLATLMDNLRMVQNVCAALAERGCSHVVYVSSDAVYSDDAHLVSEQSCCDPISFHGLMHLVRERALEATAKAKQIPLAILRPCAMYGLGDTHNGYGPNRFVRTARKEQMIQLFGNGEEKRDHVHIADVVDIIQRCIEHQTKGVLNIATGESVSFFDVAQMVSELAGTPVNVQSSPRQSPITHRHFDITRLLQAFPNLSFKSLHAGLAEMVKE